METRSLQSPCDRLQAILRDMAFDPRLAPFLDRLLVFGSVARGDSHPGSDLDLLLDLTAEKPFSQFPPTRHDGLSGLLSHCSRNYGFVDVFVQFRFVFEESANLWVRDDHARGWTPASHAKALMRNAQQEGVAFLDLVRSLEIVPQQSTGEADPLVLSTARAREEAPSEQPGPQPGM